MNTKNGAISLLPKSLMNVQKYYTIAISLFVYMGGV